MADSPPTGDILHPLTSLEWRDWKGPPKKMMRMSDAQALYLNHTLYVGGGWALSDSYEKRLYIHTLSTNTWEVISTPVHSFALVCYRSSLMLVGGKNVDQSATNIVWTLDTHNQWKIYLPPMIAERSDATAIEYSSHILVAGGLVGWKTVTVVEVYNGHHWTEARSLPRAHQRMKSAIFNGHWYLAGGEGQRNAVYYATLDSVLDSCYKRQPLQSVWKKFVDIPHECSSIVVFGNRLVAVGGEKSTSSIHAYSPYNRTWVHIERTPTISRAVFIVVIPPGHLMIMEDEHKVLHQALLHVTPVDLNSPFTMKDLQQLERMVTPILSHLNNLRQKLKEAIKVTDEAHAEFDSSHLLNIWLQGRTELRPTWGHFLWILRKIKLDSIADHIETCLSGVLIQESTSYVNTTTVNDDSEIVGDQEPITSTEEEKHIAAVQKAMKERGMLDHTIVHGVFVGPARSGKNSIMERLLGRMPSFFSPSTGVAESVVQVKVMRKSVTFAANVEKNNCQWSIMDYDDEVIKLMLINSESQNKIIIPTLQAEDASSIVSEEVLCSSNTGIDKDTICESEEDLEFFDAQQELTDVPETAMHSPPFRKPSVSAIEIVKHSLRNKGRKGIDNLQDHFQRTWSLYLTNTGGQMEFQEVLPLLVSGPLIFFFTFRLDRDLNTTYTIEYDFADGTHAKPYVSTLSTLEGILQTLATISAMGTFIYKGLQKEEVPLTPKVFLIGTHKDRIDARNADAHIAKIDQQLQEAIKSTSHYDELVEFAYDNQMIFTVNNFSKDESDFQDIRSAVERVVVRDKFQMTSPAHWLIFSLALRQLKNPVIPYELCMEIGKDCGIIEEGELKEALHFIHSKMGLIRYFPYEEVKHFVVIHPQHLFDRATNLIVGTFTFEKVGKQQMDAFKQKGIFSLAEFESINSRSESGMKGREFAKLLEKLRITAQFTMNRNVMFFLPCVLAHMDTPKSSTLSKFMSIARYKHRRVPPLIVAFKRGYCPKGLGGALISYLIANEMSAVHSWKLCHEQIFKNQISFRVGPSVTAVLHIYPTHFLVTVLPRAFKSSDSRCPLEVICSEIREAIDTGIRQLLMDINYVNVQHYLTFPCKCKGDHPGTPEFEGDTLINLYCSRIKQVFSLPRGHELWHISALSTLDRKPQSESPQVCRLTETNHAVLLKQLTKHAANWRLIGTSLGFTPGELDNIHTNAFLLSNSPISWLSRMLADWLQWAPCDSRGSTDYATLESLKSALSEARLGATASTLNVS